MRHDDAVSACVRTSVKSFDELISEYRADIRSRPLDDITGTQLVGKDKKLKDAAVTARQLVTQYLRRTGQSHWAGTTPGTAQAVALCIQVQCSCSCMSSVH